ncbi:MAG: lamin tail domain-containing protein, partial [Bacteroidota bacterium]
ELFIKTGVVLDYETKTSYSITINVDDTTVGSTPDASVNYTLNIIDQVVETTPVPSIIISEVAPWSSGNSPLAADWFEVTNTGTGAVNITGWKMDDNSNSFGSSVALNGITSIAPGESVIFIETSNLATASVTFKNLWFGSNPPAGLQIGSYTGSGVGLSTGGDAVNLFNGSGTLQANVSFGASTITSPLRTFNNAAGLNNATISQLSVVGVNDAFIALNDANEVGSPGTTGKLFVSEVAPWSSGNSPVAADWFEVTNTHGIAVDITGWKMDDNSGSFAAAVALNGITSIAPGESVIFIETATPSTKVPQFLSNWFGANPPAGLHVGSYTGSGVGLGTSGDAVNLYNSTGALQANVAFGVSPGGPFPSFDNAAGLNNTTISQLSTVGVNGAFIAVNSVNEVGSPGTIVNSPCPTITVTATQGAAILCNGDSTTVTVTASGGTAPYIGTGTFTVSPGTYTYSITDANGCTGSVQVTVAPGVGTTPGQPAAFTTKSTFVYKGDNGIVYTVPNTAGVTYSWLYNGTGATINGTGNSVSIDYSTAATNGTLSVTAGNTCGTSVARTLDIYVNTAITVNTTNYDYSFVTVGCNRVDYLDTAFTTGDIDYSTGRSTANVYQLKRLFNEIAHLNPLPDFLIMTGDIVMGYKTPSTADTTELAKQLTSWVELYQASPLASLPIQLVAIPGNHETQDKAAGKHSFATAEQIFTRIMAPYILGSNGPGVGGPDSLSTDQSKLTYSFNFHGDHFIIMDTDPVGKDNQVPYKWIGSDIQAARAANARHIFAFGHKPAYSSPLTPGGGLDAAATLPQRDSLWKYFEDNNCEAMFSAHEHLWDSINPHSGKTWQVINGNGGSRVEPVWVGAGKQYYGYTIVNIYSDRTVNVMGVGRNTTQSPSAGGTPYPVNEDYNASTVRNNFNICLTTNSNLTVATCNSYIWHGTTYSSSGTYTYTSVNSAGCDSIEHLALTINSLPTVVASNVSGCAGTAIALSGLPAGGTFSKPNPYTGASTTYTYSYTDGNGCSNTSSAANITV